MKKELFLTRDGSHSIHVTGWNENYHSVHGAIQESKHVFIEAGLNALDARSQLNILEMGFGTGLNVLLTMMNSNKRIVYETIEAYPIDKEMAGKLNYLDILNAQDLKNEFEATHDARSGIEIELRPGFYFTKQITKLEDLRSTRKFDLVYYDAFAPRVQPELWTKAIFEKIFELMNNDGIMVTYCAKGEVKRNMKAAGFIVERLPGPLGKREMTRCIRKQ